MTIWRLIPYKFKSTYFGNAIIEQKFTFPILKIFHMICGTGLLFVVCRVGRDNITGVTTGP